MIFKAALGPILYRRTMDCPWKDILGASILSVGLAHAIARGVFAGLVKKKGVFVVTPKGWRGGGALAFFNPIREEIGMLFALLLGAATLVAQRSAANLETQLWVGILCLQCIPLRGRHPVPGGRLHARATGAGRPRRSGTQQRLISLTHVADPRR